MNEIEKLYEKAGIKKIELDYPDNFEPFYPDFTTEKQIELIKFLLKKAVYYDVKDDKYWFYYEECESAGYKPFDEAIAHFINKLWQDLTEQEKEKLKEILK